MAKANRRPAKSYSRPHPEPTQQDQKNCRALINAIRAQSAALAKQAEKSAAKGLTRWNDVTCLWEVTDAGRALAAAADIPPMTN